MKSVCNIRPVVVVPQHQHTNQLMFNISQYRVLLSPSHQSSRGLQDYRRHPVYFLNHHLTAVSKLETRKRQVQVHEVFYPPTWPGVDQKTKYSHFNPSLDVVRSEVVVTTLMTSDL